MISCIVAGQDVNIIPKPAELQLFKGTYTITPKTYIYIKDQSLRNAAGFFNDYLMQVYGFKLSVGNRNQTENTIWISSDKENDDAPGAHTLRIYANRISIGAENAKGAFYAVQSLIQLLPFNQSNKLSVPQLLLHDKPRFAYRGMMLDAGRHFYPVSVVKKYIDYLAYYKFNKFHWHLTEDQGWRIEIKKYPKLTSAGGWRNGTIIGHYPGKGNDNQQHGGFYTQEEIREIVQYAAARYIDVIPEIEMPGHSCAAIAAYPALSCFPDEATKQYYSKDCAWAGDTSGKQVIQSWGVYNDVFVPSEYTFKFLQDVLDEVIALFPSQYIHIGGDECPKANWKRSAFCQQLIKEKGLKDEHGLQSYFIQRMEKYINSKGKKIIGWDEILEGGLAPNASVMSWRGEEGGIEAAKQNHDVIMTPGSHCYLDHSQSKNEDSVTIGGYLSLGKVYSYEPIPVSLNAEQAKHILGAQGNLWTEYISNTSKLEYMIFPRMIALSEVLWSPREKRDWKDFEKRLPSTLERLDKQKINYSKSYDEIKESILPTKNQDALIQHVAGTSIILLSRY